MERIKHTLPDRYRRNPIKSILLPILAGLICAQALGTLFVRQSNLTLLAHNKALATAGWLPLPMGPAVKPLAAMTPALLGALFYTLSAGTGLALLTWAMLCLRNRLFPGSRIYLYVTGVLWTGLLVLVNSHGLILYPTLFVLLVPPATALLMDEPKSAWFNPGSRSKPRWLPLVILVLLTGLWSTQFNRHLFIAIRDHVLLSNPVGQRINSFYYRYTLYAAEAFKPFYPKAVKTCVLEGFPDNADHTRLRKLLTRWDILVVPATRSPDLILSEGGGSLILASSRGTRIVADRTDFYKNPEQWLRTYSEKSDRHSWFRRLILGGLLIGFPCLLYVVVYTLVCTLLSLFFNERRATRLSAVLCLLIGTGLFILMFQGRAKPMEASRLKAALEDPAWPVRVAALHFMETQKMEIAAYASYGKLLHSPMAVERYWLARVMAASHDPVTYKDLLLMMDDPHPNVVCQAYYALGERRNPAAIKAILNKMRSSDHWYAQWYGYRAIRRLGWRQTLSKPTH